MSSDAGDWAPLLKRVGFFSSFGEAELAGIAKRMTFLSLPKNAILFHQGDVGDALYIVISGRIRLTQTRDGQERTLGYLSRGECMGEMSLLTGEPRAHTATVDATADFLLLYRKDFENLLKQMPSMAVHLSNVLSHYLLETTRPRAAGGLPSKIYPVMSHLSLPNRVVLTVNLALSMLEQTRRRVLLLDVLDQDPGIFALSLGLHPVRVQENSLRQEDLQNPDILRRLTVRHPSGLELLSLPWSLMEGKLFNSLYPFLNILRENYDVTLLALPPKLTPVAQAIVEESNNLLFLEKNVLSESDSALLSELAAVKDFKNLTRVQLSDNPYVPGAHGPTHRLLWPATLGRERLDGGKVFLQDYPLVQKGVDRLSRALGGIRIGFAMGSGAAYGYTMIGMLRSMERAGIYPDVVAGTSIGALIGSFYAAGKNPDELEEIAKSITKQKLWTLADVTFPWQGLVLGRQVLGFLKEILGDITFEELRLPFACVATDIVTGEEVVLWDGKVAEAVRASLSLPFFFQPFFHKGRYLVDGGLVNPVPTRVAASMGANVLISVNLTAKPSMKKMPGIRSRRHSSSYWKGPNIFEVLLKTIYTMQFEVAQARSEIAHVVLAPDTSKFTWSEFHRAPDLIKIGEELMEENLPKIKSLLPLYADYCRMPLRLPPAVNQY